MADVTVLGATAAAKLTTITIPFGSSPTSTAQTLATIISEAVTVGTLTPVYFNNSNSDYYLGGSVAGASANEGTTAPVLAYPKTGELVIGATNGDTANGGTAVDGPATLQVPYGYNVLIDNSASAVAVTGSGAFGMIVLAGYGGLTYTTGQNGSYVGSGTIVSASFAGDSNVINVAASLSSVGGYLIDQGAGANTITTQSGENTIVGGSGSNFIDVSTTVTGAAASNDTISLSGTDTVTASGGTGHDTITVTDTSNNVIVSFASGFTGTLYFSNTSTSTGTAIDSVDGGGGVVTLFGGLAQTDFTAGTGGGSYIINGEDIGGTSSATGAASGDQIFASSIGGGALAAGSGNETLVGAGHLTDGHDTTSAYPNATGSSVSGTQFFGSSDPGSSTKIYVGTGVDTITIGKGTEYIDGHSGVGHDLYVFNSALTGSSSKIEIQDYTVGADSISLSGYNETTTQIAANSAISGKNTVVTLSDGTQITFDNVTTLFHDPSLNHISST